MTDGSPERVQTVGGFVDDTEETKHEVSPSDNVYSYFMFITPTEFAKGDGNMSADTLIAILLLLLNFFMQFLLLYVIYNEVVIGNIEWQNGIMRLDGQEWNLFAPKPPDCNPGGSLCFVEDGVFTCAPPTVQLTGRWDELDTNKDGIWTREEVEANREELKCKYVVDPIEVFDVFINFLKSREKVLWLHPDIKEGRAIAKPYFTFAAGDIIMCGYRNKDMCGNVLKKGAFHVPLKYHTSPRVGTSIDSALKYCYDLLRPGGTCETFLPSTYSVWKIEATTQCLAPHYSKFVYTNPGNNVTKSLLKVDYEARGAYETSKTTLFKTYKCIIIGMWLMAMMVELKDMIIIFTWCARFPSDAGMEPHEAVEMNHEDPDDEESDVKYKINAISSSHRMNVLALNLVRFFLTTVLAFVGVNFLLNQTDYIGLLMDGVALVFVVEIAQILYSQVLRVSIREQTEALEPMEVEMFGIEYLNARPALMDFLWFTGCVLVAIIVLWHYSETLVNPLYDALECTCLGEGENCREAQRFSYDFWYNYWKVDVPKVFEDVDAMKSAGSGDQSDSLFQRGLKLGAKRAGFQAVEL